MERMMKVQDVLLKAMAKKITWWSAAEILGVTDRTMHRWRERLEADGYSGLADRRKGKPSAKRIPLATIEKVLKLYKETYYDLNIRHGGDPGEAVADRQDAIPAQLGGDNGNDPRTSGWDGVDSVRTACSRALSRGWGKTGEFA
jgi:hypothetical protein